MKGERLGNLEYESASMEEVLARLQQIPQIEILRMYKGHPRNGFHAPAYLTQNGVLRSTENIATIEDAVSFSDSYALFLGNNIVVQRKKMPKKLSLLRLLGLLKQEELSQDYQETGDLIDFLKDNIGIKKDNSYVNSPPILHRYPKIVYFEKIGEVSAQNQLILQTQDYPERIFEDEVRTRDSPKHIVIPTTLWVTGENRK